VSRFFRKLFGSVGVTTEHGGKLLMKTNPSLCYRFLLLALESLIQFDVVRHRLLEQIP